MRERKGELKKVSDLFEKYRKNLQAPETTVINAFLEVVEDLYGITVPRQVVFYDPATKTLTINGHAILKSELALHRKEIDVHLKGRLGEKNVPKLIF